MSRFTNSEGRSIPREWVLANAGSWSGFKRAVAEHRGVEYRWEEGVPEEYAIAFLVFKQGLSEEQAKARREGRA